MKDPFRNYDQWLEAPIQRMYAEGDAIEAAAERYDLDPEADIDEILERIRGDEEAAAEAEAERRAEARLDDEPPPGWEP